MPPTTLTPPLHRLGGAIGGFDLFHVGHLRFLQAARARCSHLKVGVATSRLLGATKGRPPVCDEQHRLEIIRGLRGVDEACLFDIGLDQTAASAQWLVDWPIDCMFVSSDWIDTPRWQRLGPLLTERGIACEVLPYTEGISTTALRQQLAHQPALTDR